MNIKIPCNELRTAKMMLNSKLDINLAINPTSQVIPNNKANPIHPLACPNICGLGSILATLCKATDNIVTLNMSIKMRNIEFNIEKCLLFFDYGCLFAICVFLFFFIVFPDIIFETYPYQCLQLISFSLHLFI